MRRRRMSRTRVSDAASGSPWNCQQGPHRASRWAGKEALQAGSRACLRMDIGTLSCVCSLLDRECRVAVGRGPVRRPGASTSQLRSPVCTATVEAFPLELLDQVRELELQGVSAAESGDISTALERFSEAIRLLPERASGYNNRAQALRLRGDVAGALQDLDAAIRLSRGRGRAACQSFVQRGLIHRLQARDEDARRDLERAARLGSAFARQQLVLLNPYSALCNQMLCEMLGRLRNPDGAGSD
ncbi:tetratricopeptide repeat protein 36 isoform X1 [Melospiza georgiana]|uniref:tetratricopeptide repeat protein 36 isoform X1 n=1 Tax=Melospiza georgiana TaxID=44398 RepID=UPI0025ABE08C|nr:tetratricopeptide repeat protein 36 isoform X1 [Melospiza georgiana]